MTGLLPKGAVDASHLTAAIAKEVRDEHVRVIWREARDQRYLHDPTITSRVIAITRDGDLPGQTIPVSRGKAFMLGARDGRVRVAMRAGMPPETALTAIVGRRFADLVDLSSPPAEHARRLLSPRIVTAVGTVPDDVLEVWLEPIAVDPGDIATLTPSEAMAHLSRLIEGSTP